MEWSSLFAVGNLNRNKKYLCQLSLFRHRVLSLGKRLLHEVFHRHLHVLLAHVRQVLRVVAVFLSLFYELLVVILNFIGLILPSHLVLLFPLLLMLDHRILKLHVPVNFGEVNGLHDLVGNVGKTKHD